MKVDTVIYHYIYVYLGVCVWMCVFGVQWLAPYYLGTW